MLFDYIMYEIVHKNEKNIENFLQNIGKIECLCIKLQMGFTSCFPPKKLMHLKEAKLINLMVI